MLTRPCLRSRNRQRRGAEDLGAEVLGLAAEAAAAPSLPTIKLPETRYLLALLRRCRKRFSRANMREHRSPMASRLGEVTVDGAEALKGYAIRVHGFESWLVMSWVR
jgi:hypothetical protein